MQLKDRRTGQCYIALTVARATTMAAADCGA